MTGIIKVLLKDKGYDFTTKYILEKYSAREIEGLYFDTMSSSDYKKVGRRSSKEEQDYYSVVSFVYDNRYGLNLNEGNNREKLADEVRKFSMESDTLKKAIIECCEDPLKWYSSNVFSSFTISDNQDDNKRFFIKCLLENVNMTTEIAEETCEYYLSYFKNFSVHDSFVSFMLDNKKISSVVIKKYLESNGRFLSDKNILKIIGSEKADSSILNLLLDKCFDESLFMKQVRWDGPRLWGDMSFKGLGNLKIISAILSKKSISLDIFIKTLEKVSRFGFFARIWNGPSGLKINKKMSDFFDKIDSEREKIGDEDREKFGLMIKKFSFMCTDFRLFSKIISSSLIDKDDLTSLLNYSNLRDDQFETIVVSDKADDDVYNQMIIRLLCMDNGYHVKHLIGKVQERSLSYNNCLLDVLKDKFSISGNFAVPTLHPLLLSFCVFGTCDNEFRKKVSGFDSKIDFDSLNNYMYSLGIKTVDDLFNESGQFFSSFSEKGITCLGSDLFELFSLYCSKLRATFSVEKFELDEYSADDFRSDSEKFIALCSLMMNEVPKSDKTQRFISECLGDKYIYIYSSSNFNKRFTSLVSNCNVKSYKNIY